MLTAEEKSHLYDFLDLLCNEFIHNQLRCNSDTYKIVGQIFSEDDREKIIIYRYSLINYKQFLFFNRKVIVTEKVIEISVKISNKDVFHSNLRKVELSSKSINKNNLIIIKNNKELPFLSKPYNQIIFEVTTNEKLYAVINFMKNYIDRFDKSIFR